MLYLYSFYRQGTRRFAIGTTGDELLPAGVRYQTWTNMEDAFAALVSTSVEMGIEYSNTIEVN